MIHKKKRKKKRKNHQSVQLVNKLKRILKKFQKVVH